MTTVAGNRGGAGYIENEEPNMDDEPIDEGPPPPTPANREGTPGVPTQTGSHIFAGPIQTILDSNQEE